MRKALHLLRYVPQSLIAAALVAAALFFQPWVLIDPIDRFSHINPASRSMIPDVFAQGEDIADATERLGRSGYIHSAIEPVAGEPIECNDTACERRKAGFTDFFRKDDVAFNIACALDYVVWIRREGDRVTDAENDVYSRCL